MIPTKRNRLVQLPVDAAIYARRNMVERCFNKLKNARRLATRYDKTDRLIASNKVEGTVIYNRDGEKLGSIYNFIVDKRSGEVEYAFSSSADCLASATTIIRSPGIC